MSIDEIKQHHELVEIQELLLCGHDRCIEPAKIRTDKVPERWLYKPDSSEVLRYVEFTEGVATLVGFINCSYVVMMSYLDDHIEYKGF